MATMSTRFCLNGPGGRYCSLILPCQETSKKPSVACRAFSGMTLTTCNQQLMPTWNSAKRPYPTVEAIIVEEQARFEEWLQGRQVLPVLVELRRKTKAIAVGELDRILPRLEELDPQYQAVVSQLVHRIVNKVLHEPTIRLKASAADGNGGDYAQAVRELFALEGVSVAPVPVLNGKTNNGDKFNGYPQNGREAADQENGNRQRGLDFEFQKQDLLPGAANNGVNHDA